MTGNFRGLMAAGLISICAVSFAAAARAEDRPNDRPWMVEKSSGEVWITRSGAEPVSIDLSGGVKAGDDIRTGRNGRVMLSRGEERIMVQPNSAIAIPAQQTGQYATTIQQQAGTIVLQVEKKNVQHFEVETPYLAAVVKGTQFRVSVNPRGASVDVVEGRVQVADFKSGQNALVDPGQRAAVNAAGKAGLALSGSGKLNAIETGAPRVSGLRAMVVPRSGFTAPARAGAIAQSVSTFNANDLGMKSFAKAVEPAKAEPVAGTAKNSAVGVENKSGKRASLNGMSNAVRSQAVDGDIATRGAEDASLAVYNSAAAAAAGSGAATRASAVGGAVGNTASAAGGVVGNTVNGLGGTVSGAGNAVGGTVNGLGNTVGNTVGGVGNVVGGTTNAVGGLLGGGNGNGNGNAYGNNGGNGVGNALGLLKK